ncbi:MAG: glutamate racemase [Gaiellales bacterium]|jgi:glutamate racemase|nr:glutamate racemase [Gaiellales bacterium]
MAADDPIAVLASGFGGLAVCDAIQRALPKEDVVLLADHAYAPYATKRAAFVVQRVSALAGDISAEWTPKAIVLASAQGCADGLDRLRAQMAPVPVIGIDGIVGQATARSPRGRVALVTGAGCLRGAQLARVLKRERAGGLVTWVAVDGLREAVESRTDARAQVQAALTPVLQAGVDAIALGCPHASAVGIQVKAFVGESVAVVDSSALAAERVRLLLMRSGMAARRRRPGRRILVSSNPALGQAGLARS